MKNIPIMSDIVTGDLAIFHKYKEKLVKKSRALNMSLICLSKKQSIQAILQNIAGWQCSKQPGFLLQETNNKQKTFALKFLQEWADYFFKAQKFINNG